MITEAGEPEAHADRQLKGRLRVASGLDVVVIGDNEVLIQHGTRSRPAELLRDTDLTGVLGRVLRGLRHADVGCAELLEEFHGDQRAEAEDMILELTAKGIITDASQSAVEQYLGFTMDGQRPLADTRVAVIGAGPVGARICSTLVGHGIGRLALLDERPADAVWRTFTRAVPAPGTTDERAAHHVLRDGVSDSATSVTAVDGGFSATGVLEATRGADLTVLALEQPHPRLAHLVNRACVNAARPWLLAQIDGSLGLAGPLFVPPETACYNDYETLTRSVSTNAAMDRLYERYLLGRGNGSFFPGLPAFVDIVAGYASLAVVQFLVSGSSWALARVTSVDFGEMIVDVQDVLRLPRCPVCGGGSEPPQPPFPAMPPQGGVG
ncbi:MAG TPA: TOMM precursor leader peptide-binding protein [Acidimicrobiales bacterium]|nr:TOMM precursor leader peptide-binding protein [Acidimicrobiales bacterium]